MSLTRITCMTLVLALALAAAFASGAAAEEAMDCSMCHADKAKAENLHPAVMMGCQSCHTGVDSTQMPHDLGGTEGGLAAQVPELCFMCHDKGKFTGEGNIHMPVENGMCLTCHDPHGSAETRLLRAPRPEVCYDCHDKAMFFGPNVHEPVGLGTCEACHDPHKSNKEKLLKNTDKAVCFNCHAEEAFTKTNIHAPVAGGDCMVCHLPHASQNSTLLVRKGTLLCRECHSEVEKRPHAIMGFTAGGHPLRGRKDPLRSGKVFSCLSCHNPHSSDWPTLFRYQSSNMFELCIHCHDF